MQSRWTVISGRAVQLRHDKWLCSVDNCEKVYLQSSLAYHLRTAHSRNKQVKYFAVNTRVGFRRLRDESWRQEGMQRQEGTRRQGGTRQKEGTKPQEYLSCQISPSPASFGTQWMVGKSWWSSYLSSRGVNCHSLQCSNWRATGFQAISGSISEKIFTLAEVCLSLMPWVKSS